MLIDDDKALLGEVQPVVRLELGHNAARKALPGSQGANSMRQGLEVAGTEDDVQALV